MKISCGSANDYPLWSEIDAIAKTTHIKKCFRVCLKKKLNQFGPSLNQLGISQEGLVKACNKKHDLQSCEVLQALLSFSTFEGLS